MCDLLASSRRVRDALYGLHNSPPHTAPPRPVLEHFLIRPSEPLQFRLLDPAILNDRQSSEDLSR